MSIPKSRDLINQLFEQYPDPVVVINPYRHINVCYAYFSKQASSLGVKIHVNTVPNTNLIKLSFASDPFVNDDPMDDIDIARVQKYFGVEPESRFEQRNCYCWTCTHGNAVPVNPIRSSDIYSVYKSDLQKYSPRIVL